MTPGPAETTGLPADAGTGGEGPQGFRAGVGVAVLDRPVGVSQAGYGGRTGGTATAWSGLFHGTRGFHGLPTIKAMALESDGERVVFVKSPTMSAESSLTDATVAKLATVHGLDLAGRVIMGAGHSHHVHGRYWRLPDFLGVVGADTVDEEVIDILATAFAGAVAAAIDDLAPAQWGYSAVDGWDPDDRIYGDRRTENNPTYGKDPRLVVFAVRRPDGSPMATLINFGMHGTLLGTDNELLSEDAPGAVEMKFEEYFHRQTGEPILGMFIQSGGGDASPAGGFLGHQGPQRMEMVGETAAPLVYDAYESIDWRDDAEIVARSQRVDLRYESFGYDRIPEFSGELFGNTVEYTWGGWQCKGTINLDDQDPATSMAGLPKQCLAIGNLVDAPHPEVHQTYLSTARVGDLFFVSLPGEPTSSVIAYLRRRVAERSLPGDPIDVMAFGYSQDHLLYLTHPDDWFQGGYEAEMSVWGPFAAKWLVDTQLAEVDEMLAGNAGPAYREQSPGPAATVGFVPRPFERSTNAGEIVGDIVVDLMRMDTARLRFGGGDPSVGSPRVRVQADRGDGTFVDVPSPAGVPGGALDNSRYHMMTHYEPVPAPSAVPAASRAHEWVVDWEIPADFPAGIYRLVASGPWWDGSAVQSFETTSTPFAVHQSTAATLTPEVSGDTLTLELQLPPNPAVSEQSWLRSGWRVHDMTAGPSDPVRVRSPLAIRFVVGGVPQPQTYVVPFDPGADRYVFALSRAAIADPTGVQVAVGLASDVLESEIVADLTP